MSQQLRDREHRDVDRGRAGIELGNVEQRAEQLVHGGERVFDAADNLTALAARNLPCSCATKRPKAWSG